MRGVAAAVFVLSALVAGGRAWAAGPGDWTTYLHDTTRDNAVQDGRSFAGGTLHLTESWSFKTGGPVVGSPAIVGGYAYVPSWDGYLYALDLSTHQAVWKRFLGTETIWGGQTGGVNSSPTFAPDVGAHGAILVGGGGAEQPSDANLYFYALDAKTGDVLWKTSIGNNAKDAVFDSPLYLQGSVYIGIATSGGNATSEAPTVPGILFELDGHTGKIVQQVSMASPGKLGGAIWGSISADPTGQRIFVPTGDGTNPKKQHLTTALVAVSPTTLKVVDHWQRLSLQAAPDIDFGSSVTVFQAGTRTLIGANPKGGTYFALDAAHLKKGPVWSRDLGNMGAGQHADDNFTGAFATGAGYPGGATLYIAAPNVMIKKHTYPGGLFALNPSSGHVIWSVKVNGVTGNGALTVYDDTLIVPAPSDYASGGAIEVHSAKDGHLLASFPTADAPLGAPVVVDGTIYIGTADGVFHAISMTS